MKFSVRDTVRLKFGGPVMVVEAVQGDLVQTFWFHRGLLRREKFLAGNLTAAGAPGTLAAAMAAPKVVTTTSDDSALAL